MISIFTSGLGTRSISTSALSIDLDEHGLCFSSSTGFNGSDDLSTTVSIRVSIRVGRETALLADLLFFRFEVDSETFASERLLDRFRAGRWPEMLNLV